MSSKKSGFTLVEVLIVVVIMAVLAAVVVPQFSNSTEDAQKSTAEFNLSTLRSVVQTFRGQHSGAAPTLDVANKELPGLLGKTLKSGALDNDGPYGPYLTDMPENPFTGVADVKATSNVPPQAADVTADNKGGWLIDTESGQLWLDSSTGDLEEFKW